MAFSPLRVDADEARAKAVGPEAEDLILDLEGSAELDVLRAVSSSSSCDSRRAFLDLVGSGDLDMLDATSSSCSGGVRHRRRCTMSLGRVLLVTSASFALGLLAVAAAVGRLRVQERKNTAHTPAASPGGVVGLEASVPPPASSTSITLDELVADAFPGQLHHWFTKWNPMFTGASLHEHLDCAKPHPSIYFGNPREASYPLFHNKSQTFPMAMDYMDSSDWARPESWQKQTVLGFAEMQWAYYHYNGDLSSTSPYLVISMNPFKYTPLLNFQFVECGLLGWPGFSSFVGGDYPLRLVIKNPTQGQPCTGFETGHAWCNLETSWGAHPEVNNWRPTAMEVNALVQLCKHKYQCDIEKAILASPEGKEVPQVYVFRVLRDAAGNPLPPAEESSAAPSAPPADAGEAPPAPSPMLHGDEVEIHDCHMTCEFEGWTGTCQHYTQWVANQYGDSDPNACVEGYVTTLEICPHCWGCALADSQCVAGGAGPEALAAEEREEEGEEFMTPAQGCDTLCHHDGWLATCNTRIQFAANHEFQDQLEPCADAMMKVLEDCPACATQCQELTESTCGLQTADQWTALMLRREEQRASPAPEFVQTEDAYVK